MPKGIRYFLPVLILSYFAFSGCGGDDDPSGPEPRTYQDLEADFDAINISSGIQDVTLQATDALFWDVRIIPPNDLSTSRPLVIALHGAWGGNPDAHKTTACYIEPGLENLDAFIISPFAGAVPWFDGSQQQQILTLINLATKFWPVDPDKVVVTGYSNGGNGSWFYAETRPEVFSAGIPMASSYSTFDTDSTGRKIETPLYVIHGENDELFPVDSTALWVQQSVNAGSTIEFVIAPGLTHNEPCSYVSYLQDAANWLTNTVWDN